MAIAYDDTNIFARILRGEIPCDKVAETDHALAFRDIRPQRGGMSAWTISRPMPRTRKSWTSRAFAPGSARPRGWTLHKGTGVSGPLPIPAPMACKRFRITTCTSWAGG